MAVEQSASDAEGMRSWQDNLRSSRLLMSTGDAFNEPLAQSEEHAQPSLDRNNHFKSCEWSPDGTTLLTSTADNILSTFILPPDLLDKTESQTLQPYHQHVPPGPVYATAMHPGFSLSEPSTTIYIASIRDMPLRLISPFSSKILATYPLINPNTEAFVAPHSLLFDTHGSHETTNFLAGSDSEISIFDLNRPGTAPHTTLKTIPSKRKKLVGGGVGMKGLVSSMALSKDGFLAAGTFTRWIGLYDGAGRGSEVGVFQLGRNDRDQEGIGAGSGVAQLAWTENGKYLIAAERMSGGLSVWDVRGTGRRLAWLSGRKAMTMQRLMIDVVGSTVISGDTEGNVRLWDSVGSQEGVLGATSEVKLHDGEKAFHEVPLARNVGYDAGLTQQVDAVSAAVMHPSAAILATCSGQRRSRQIDSETDDLATSTTSYPSETSNIDNTLKVWSLYGETSWDNTQE